MGLVGPPRRSCLSVPGSSPNKIAKAPTLGADEVILDLEDAVAAGEKDAARRAVAAAAVAPEFAAVTLAVRINGPRTPWFEADASLLGEVRRPLSVVVPKVENREGLDAAVRLLDRGGTFTEPEKRPRLQALIETPRGIAAAAEIAAHERVESLILGYADLAAALGRGAEAARDPRMWLAIQDALLIAARRAGRQAIDGPWLGVAVDDQFLAAARHAGELGFDGKWAIHPDQVTSLNSIFAPGADELRRARAILATLEEAGRSGRGAAEVDGEMVDEALAEGARRVLARAAASGPGGGSKSRR